ncbi:sensor histidine kinase [Actinophytocola sediminis]
MTSRAVEMGGSLARRVFGQDVSSSLTRQSVLVAAACLVTDAVGFVTRGPAHLGTFEVLALLGLVAADAALATSPRHSGWVALAHACLTPVLALFMPGRSASSAGQLVSAYRAGAWLRRWPAGGALLALAFGVLASLWIGGVTDVFAMVTLTTANSALPWLVGRYTTARKAYVDELRRQRENSLRDAEAEVNRAVAREREAIARDLHDVISHHVSAVGVHAAAARMNMDDRGVGPVHTSLVAVEASSQAAMVDLRRLLGLLHEDDESSQPGIGALPELFDGIRSAGQRVTFVVYNEPCPIPHAVDLTLYRVTQEMMTNALRHGDGTAVRVELDYGDEYVSITARNPIAAAPGGSPNHGSGRGLAGIRKRVELVGGSSTFGPAGDGQYWETSVTVRTGGGS